METAFQTFVQEAFGLRRKQMRRVLRTMARLDADAAERLLRSVDIDPECRPETLAAEDFARLLLAVRGSEASARGS